MEEFDNPSRPRGTVIVTGANGGLGSAIVNQFASQPELTRYHAVCTVRRAETATALRSMLSRADERFSHRILSMNLARLSEVRDAATAINRSVAAGEIPPIRALILNAGYVEFEDQTWTEDGFDMSFASSYLGHWLFALMLLESMDHDNGRIVVVGSSVHEYVEISPKCEVMADRHESTQDPRNNAGAQYVDPKWRPIFRDSTEPIARGTWSTTKEDPSFKGGYRRYGGAKLCQVLMIPELQRRLNADQRLQNISVLGIDPGSVPTGITRRGNWMICGLWTFIMPWLVVILQWLWPNGTHRTTQKSSLDIVAAALDASPALGEKPKGLYLDGENVIEMSAEAQDPRKQAILWADTVRYTGIKAEETALTHLS